MEIKKILITISFLFSTMMVFGQGFSYTFTDPCTLKSKDIFINSPNGSVSLIYSGQIQSFTQTQLQSGALESWINQVNATNPQGSGPCGGVGIAQSTNLNVIVASNSIAVLTSVMSTMSSLSSLSSISGGAGSAIQGTIQSNEKVASNGNKDKDKGTTTGSTTTGGSTTGGTTTGSTTTGGSTTGGSTSGSTTSGGSTSESNKSNGESDASGQEKADDAVSSSSSSSSQVKAKVAAVKRGNIMMTGDIVTISSASGAEPTQLRINMSFITSNTSNTFAKGALVNYTSAIDNSSITLFAAWRRKNLTSIVANSSMLNFEKDFFNTTSIMESYKIKKITATLGVNYTTGNLGESKFQSLSTLGGVVGNFNVGKKMSTTLMFVTVYSPFVYYYEGMWYQSGLLAVPFVAVDYKLTQKFKMNISFSGVQQFKSDAINYQVLLGAKALL
jgi:hypothetical protein